MPRWVRGFVLVGLAVVGLVVLLLLLSGDHGPARHVPASEDASVDPRETHTPPVEHP